MIDSKELAQLNRELSEIGRDLAAAAIDIPNEITRELAIGANDIRNTIIKSMRDTKRAPWSYPRGKGRTHHPSAPGSPPAIDFGELVRTIMFDVRALEVEIGSYGGAPYADDLEFGNPSRHLRPRPFLDPAVKKHREEIVDKVGKGAFEIMSRPFRNNK
jgi:hypothetical protein